MLKVDWSVLAELEREHPGFRNDIRHLEAVVLPPCPYCRCAATAVVECANVAGAPSLAFASTKVRLLWRGTKPGEYYCNACGQYFG